MSTLSWPEEWLHSQTSGTIHLTCKVLLSSCPFVSQKLVYKNGLEALVKTSGCESPRHCVFTMTPVDLSTREELGPTNVFYPSSLSEAVGLEDPYLKVKIL